MSHTRTTLNGSTNYYTNGEKVLLKSLDPTVPHVEATIVSYYVIAMACGARYRYAITVMTSIQVMTDNGLVDTPAAPTPMVVDESELLKLYKPATLNFHQVLATC